MHISIFLFIQFLLEFFLVIVCASSIQKVVPKCEKLWEMDLCFGVMEIVISRSVDKDFWESIFDNSKSVPTMKINVKNGLEGNKTCV